MQIILFFVAVLMWLALFWVSTRDFLYYHTSCLNSRKTFQSFELIWCGQLDAAINC